MTKPVSKAEKKAKWERDECRYACHTRKFLRWAKNQMTKARRRNNKNIIDKWR